MGDLVYAVNYKQVVFLNTGKRMKYNLQVGFADFVYVQL